jgi:hypothetical protein
MKQYTSGKLIKGISGKRFLQWEFSKNWMRKSGKPQKRGLIISGLMKGDTKNSKQKDFILI